MRNPGLIGHFVFVILSVKIGNFYHISREDSRIVGQGESHAGHFLPYLYSRTHLNSFNDGYSSLFFMKNVCIRSLFSSDSLPKNAPYLILSPSSHPST